MKQKKITAVIIWLHLFAFSLWMLISDGNPLEGEKTYDKDYLVQTVVSSDELIRFYFYKEHDVDTKSTLTYLFVGHDEKAFFKSINSPEVDTIYTEGHVLVVKDTEGKDYKYSFKKFVSGKVSYMLYENGEKQNLFFSDLFTLNKLGGFIGLIFCILLVIIAGVEEFKKRHG